MYNGEPISPREIVILEFNSLRGRWLSLIETAGLPYHQQKSLKTHIKSLSYQSQAVIGELVETLDSDHKKFSYVTQKLEEHDTEIL